MVLAIPQSTDFGLVFKQLGVKHVVAFEFIEDFKDMGNEIEALLMPIRYNYVYTFCV